MPAFAHDLARFGPQSRQRDGVSLAEARRYCSELARSHYENFSVASFLLPRHLRAHFYHVYAYCRWADDLADETTGPEASLALLDWWEEELSACYEGQATHPVFVALAETIREFSIPRRPFFDLLVAFRRDQRQTRYETRDDLLDYCRYSANPVGQLVLYLGQCHCRETAALSDEICTGLQLANFWQDVRRDGERGRLYLPGDDCRAAGVEMADFSRPSVSEPLRRLLRREVDWAREFLRRGQALSALVPRFLALDIDLFAQGGLAILDRIEAIDYDVLARRPTLSRARKFALLAGALWRHARRPLREANA